MNPPSGNSNHTPHTGYLLDEANRRYAAGEDQEAYQLCLEAILADPLNVQAWRLRAELAPSAEERLMSLTQVQTLDKKDPTAELESYQLLRDLLAQDPYLEYVGETDQQYRVRDRSGEMLLVPKNRRITETFPADRPLALRRANRFFRWAILGSLFAGLGAVVFAPLAAIMAYTALRTPLNVKDHKRALIIMSLSTGLLMLALPFVFLLFIHI